MRQKTFVLYTSLLIFITLFFSLYLKMKNVEITPRALTLCYYYLFVKLKFYVTGNRWDYILTILYVLSPYSLIYFLPRGLTNKQKQALRNLGHFTKIKSERDGWIFKDAQVKRRKDYDKLITPALGIELADVEKDILKYESILNAKYSSVCMEVNRDSLSFLFYFNRFEKISSSQKVEAKIFTLPVGYSNTGALIRLPLKTAVSFGVFGKIGAGKTVYLKTLIELIHEQNPLAQIITYDQKMADWSKKFCAKFNVNLVEMNTPEQLQHGIDLLKSILDKRSEISALLREHDLSHAYELMEKGILPLSEQRFLIFDEYSSYTNKSPDKNVSKLMEEFASLLNLALSQLRYSGTVIILASQRLNADSSLVNRDNILTILANGINSEMANKFTNGEGQEVKKGRWYLASSEGHSEYIKTIHFDS